MSYLAVSLVSINRHISLVKPKVTTAKITKLAGRGLKQAIAEALDDLPACNALL